MSQSQPICPDCSGPLTLGAGGEFNPWTCAAGHGLAATFSEAYERAQEDELAELWRLTKAAAPAGRNCPMCEQAMGVVDLGYDSDEAFEGAEGDGPDEGTVELDACARCRVIWFDAGELAQLPADLEDPEPSVEELAKVAEIRSAFGDRFEASVRERHGQRFAERLYRRIGRNGTARRLLRMPISG